MISLTKVIHNSNNLARAEIRAARHGVVRSTMALALAAAAALAASLTQADAGAREIGASAYSFADSLVATNMRERPPALSPFAANWSPGCFVNCGPAFGALVVRRSDLLTSNTADLSARKTADATGRPMGVGGTIVIERLESRALFSAAPALHLQPGPGHHQ